ncbi:TIGR00375 family protein [Metabacillus arenae]|uniref:TIGR00375 family protein n=1 Tax=Metabacillus arenae TaxID=2771434 RepID=A0A926NCK1_9BACI|nr:TIGR00375 family protein [Metabacillus arenae]MBD1378716.1 TIGR00375 family protein [Metabacillus arenae]
MKTYFADLHIHIGRTQSYRAVKITAANNLTLDNILIEASRNKGMDIIGIIDCHSPEVLIEIENGIKDGRYEELEDGGVRYEQTTLLLGSEIEINDERCIAPIHTLVFMPSVEKMKQFSNWMSERLKNIHLSSQRIYESGLTLQRKVKELNGLFIPAHIFTPHKGLYGSGVKASLKEVFDPNLIDAVELGLSSDTKMASKISELSRYPFLTNSDAHSLPRIGREYQKIILNEPTFKEFKLALEQREGRYIESNYGLNPLLGKYYLTTCAKCGAQADSQSSQCLICQSKRFTKGVSNRLAELADQKDETKSRPPYIHQVPLSFIPGVGPKTLEKLKNHFGTEMNILHYVSVDELKNVIPEKTAKLIQAAREGKLSLEAGGGGVYGKVTKE